MLEKKASTVLFASLFSLSLLARGTMATNPVLMSPSAPFLLSLKGSRDRLSSSRSHAGSEAAKTAADTVTAPSKIVVSPLPSAEGEEPGPPSIAYRVHPPTPPPNASPPPTELPPATTLIPLHLAPATTPCPPGGFPLPQVGAPVPNASGDDVGEEGESGLESAMEAELESSKLSFEATVRELGRRLNARFESLGAQALVSNEEAIDALKDHLRKTLRQRGGEAPGTRTKLEDETDTALRDLAAKMDKRVGDLGFSEEAENEEAIRELKKKLTESLSALDPATKLDVQQSSDKTLEKMDDSLEPQFQNLEKQEEKRLQKISDMNSETRGDIRAFGSMVGQDLKRIEARMLHSVDQILASKVDQLGQQINARLDKVEEEQREGFRLQGENLQAVGNALHKQIQDQGNLRGKQLQSMEERQAKHLTEVEKRQAQHLAEVEKRQAQHLDAVAEERKRHLTEVEKRQAEHLNEVEKRRIQHLTEVEGRRVQHLDAVAEERKRHLTAVEQRVMEGIAKVQQQLTAYYDEMEKQRSYPPAMYDYSDTGAEDGIYARKWPAGGAGVPETPRAGPPPVGEPVLPGSQHAWLS